MVHCYSCCDHVGILAELRKRGFTTTQNWEERRRHQSVRFFPGVWGMSVAVEALNKTELRIDAIIAAAKPNENGARLITVREIKALVGSPRLVEAGLRVLRTLRRWEVVKVSFVAPGGRLRWKNSYREGDWRGMFVPFTDDVEERWRMVQEAKLVAQEARNYRMSDPRFRNLR
jgi:hypothetical protein